VPIFFGAVLRRHALSCLVRTSGVSRKSWKTAFQLFSSESDSAALAPLPVTPAQSRPWASPPHGPNLRQVPPLRYRNRPGPGFREVPAAGVHRYRPGDRPSPPDLPDGPGQDQGSCSEADQRAAGRGGDGD
jgi:hypothetical protein